MANNLVIAEKPSVAQSVAKVLGCTDKQDGYLSGGGYLVSWCVGHLIELAEPETYDSKYETWKKEDLPIIPEEFKYQVTAATRKQFKVLKDLLHRDDVDCVTNACDAGREGELIFRLVYDEAKCNKPMKRLWISSMEDEAIRDGFAGLKNGREYDRLYEAAYECNPQIVDQEFYSDRSQYIRNHRVPTNDVIAYQIRQSFKPGEITPEEANAIGYELARRFTKGDYAFIVATHTDKAHIHNHIIFNSTNISGTKKFRNFFLSSLVVRHIRVVESMFQSGMDKETVISLFPQFAREDIEAIGKKIGKISGNSDDASGASVSINCS